MADKPLSAMQRREMYMQDVRNQGFKNQRVPDDAKWSLDRSVQLRGGSAAPAAQPFGAEAFLDPAALRKSATAARRRTAEIMPRPTISDLAKTARRLEMRQPLANAMFGRGEHAQPTPAIQELKEAPKPSSVTIGMTATRTIMQKPRGG